MCMKKLSVIAMALATLSLSSVSVFAASADTAQSVTQTQKDIAQSVAPLSANSNNGNSNNPVLFTVDNDGKKVGITEAYLEKAPQFNMNLKIVKDGKVIAQTSSVGISGIPVSVSSSTSVPYIRESYTNEAGQLVNVPDTFNSGYTMVGDVKPLSNGKILLDAKLDLNNLTSLQKYCVDGKCVDLPSSEVNTIHQNIVMNNNESHTFAGFIEKDGKRQNVEFVATVTLLKPLSTASNN
jgi:hypothetical protein